MWMGSVLEVICLRRRQLVWMGSGLEVIWSGYKRAELHIWTPANWAVGPHLYKAWQATGLQNLLGNQGWVPGRGS